MKIRTATMDDLNEIANVEADLTDEMYEKAAMHNEDGAWQMIFGVKMLMCDKVTPQYDRQPPLLFRTKGHSIRRVHDFMLYLKY